MNVSAGALIFTLLAAPPTPSAEALASAKRAAQLEASDRAGAVALYEKACALKHHAACAQLASLISTSDATRAFQLAEAGCQANDPLSCAVLGVFMLDGTGTTRDEHLGLQRLARACEAGLLAACGDDTSYEWEGPGKAMRFTKERSAIPRGVPWRVFKTSAPRDRKAIRFQP